MEISYCGIFHPKANCQYTSIHGYLDWYLQDKKAEDCTWIGLLTHSNNLKTGNIEVEHAIINQLEKIGLCVIPVFNYMSAENEKEMMDLPKIINTYFITEKVKIDAFIPLQMMIGIQNGKGDDLFQQTVKIFKEMNIPIFRPIISHMQNEKEWLINQSGVSSEISWAFTTNEMMGMTEPILIGYKDDTQDIHRTKPIMERVGRFASRVAKWVDMKNTPKALKKIVLMIHSAPCSGVEATIGMAAGLDVFESVVRILHELKRDGYTLGNIPQRGEELYQIVMERKAYQDFRWTTVESIVDAGGVIYRMPMEGKGGYLEIYNGLDEQLKIVLNDTWGEIPGEGMVHKNEIIITGVEFGNITVMVQPKRGCYGAKCTGEVCKILHDPSCPPPHQYIATYRYIEEILNAHGVIHVGTGGSLEYLPGKTNALSSTCWPDVVLGNLPNLYVYNAAIGVEGTIAKRRNCAVIVDYMPSSFVVNVTRIKLVKKISEYTEAWVMKSDKIILLKEEIEKLLEKLPKAQEIIKTETEYRDGLNKLKDILVQSINNSREEKLHVLGEIPSLEEAVSYIKESIDGSSPYAAQMKKICGDDYSYNILILKLINATIQCRLINEEDIERIPKDLLLNLQIEIVETNQSLTYMNQEITCLLRALDGKYVEPGLAGIPGDDLRDILPTGRNLYLLDIQKIPTPEAYWVGVKLAKQMIDIYMKEEGRIPEKVAMNMISTDISMTKGEQLSQMLYLMGIKPVWNKSGKVEGLEPITLEELKRPRIDVMVRITGVLRDAYPKVVDLMDRGVIMAANLEEPLDKNYVRKNTLNYIEKFKQLHQEDNLERRATIRIFGDKPGTYGSGVDLALKASAWKNEDDLAKIFTAFSGYAYGEELKGTVAGQEFIENVKYSDLSYEKTNGKRYDLLTSGFSASVHGGFKTIKNSFSGKQLKQYHSTVKDKERAITSTMQEELEKTMEETFFNPLWNEAIKERGYHGASEFMKRIQTIFEWKCTTDNIEHKKIDQIVEIYVNDGEMKQWFQKYNPYAIEEISRRFLELYERKRWNADDKVLNNLRKTYMELEGDMEELSESQTGEYQGGTIEVLTYEDVKEWGDKLHEVSNLFKNR